MSKKDYRNIIIILILSLIFMLFIPGLKHIYGSKVDWISQDYTIAEYIRMNFYHTKDLIPNFAFNIGLGQNMFNFVYYGFLNPIIILSYLFPFIKMIDYIIITSMLGVLSSTYLFYYWIRKKYDLQVTTIATVLFMLAGPLIFHSHRHIMFVNYMPFLLLALIGIDKFNRDKKSGLLIISVFLMIMTSYYYSVGGLLVIGLYALFSYILRKKEIKIKETFLEMINIIKPVLIGILMASIVLVPTIYIIIHNNTNPNAIIKISQIFVPNVNPENLIYGSYVVGLTGILIFALAVAYFNKKHAFKFLSIVLTILVFYPLFAYVLNGGAYIRAKAFIPFLPLYALVVAEFLENILNRKTKIYYPLLLVIFVSLIFFVTGYNNKYYYLELMIILAGLGLYYKNSKFKYFLIIPIILIAITNSIYQNRLEKFVSRKNYDIYNNEKMKEEINKITQKDQSFYRMNVNTNDLEGINKVYNNDFYGTSIYSSTSNYNYSQIYNETFNNPFVYRNKMIFPNTTNIFSQTLLGIKYVFAKENPESGYKQIGQFNDYKIYQNDNVFSLGYGTNNLYSQKYFDSLNEIEKSEILMNGIVVNKDIINEYKFQNKQINLDGLFDEFDFSKTIKEDQISNYNLTNPLKNQILFINIKLKESQSCEIGDLRIKINHINNVLTCREWLYHNNNYTFTYYFSGDEIKELELFIKKGKYNIENIDYRIVSDEIVKNASKNFDQMIVDKKLTNDNKIVGKINMKNEGYMALTIPYDEGFAILVDGKETSYEKVNGGFIGFKLNKGKHNIEIVYKTPWLNIGKSVSLIGFGLFLAVLFIENGKKIKNIDKPIK